MQITNIEYQLTSRRYIVQFEHNKVKWFKFLDRHILEDPKEFKDWLNSIIEDTKIRVA